MTCRTCGADIFEPIFYLQVKDKEAQLDCREGMSPAGKDSTCFLSQNEAICPGVAGVILIDFKKMFF
ncbi:MAG: hypothetical protein AAGH78_01090 [Cyanobacteria bacterium P01_H01_bin.58]